MRSISRSVWVLMYTQFVVMVGFGIIFPVLPFYARDLGASSLEMGLIITLFALAQFVSAPWWGALSDRLGRKPIIVFGLVGFSLSLLLIGLASTMGMILFARALGGLLAGSAFPTSLAFAADLSDKRERPRVMGRMGAAANLGFILGPAIGGALAVLGIRTTFFISAGLVLFNALSAGLLLPGDRRRTVPSAAGGDAATGGRGPVPGRAPARAAAGFGDILAAIRSRVATYYGLAMVVTFGGSSMFSMMAYFMMDRLGATTAHTSLVFAVQGATSFLFQGLVVGTVVDWFGPDRVIQGGMLTATAGFLTIAAAPTLAVVLGGMVLVSAGMALTRPTVTAVVSQRTLQPQGLALGIQSSFDSLGRMAGPVVAGLAYSLTIVGPYLASALLYLLGFAALTRIIGRRQAAACEAAD